MEQKTAQFLVLFNHFYPLASKNLQKRRTFSIDRSKD